MQCCTLIQPGSPGQAGPQHCFLHAWPCGFAWSLCLLLLKRAPALLQDKPAQLMGVAATATDGQVMLEALEVGTAGVVLRTEDAGKHVHRHQARCCDVGSQSLIC